jgi:hypothetical protein
LQRDDELVWALRQSHHHGRQGQRVLRRSQDKGRRSFSTHLAGERLIPSLPALTRPTTCAASRVERIAPFLAPGGRQTFPRALREPPFITVAGQACAREHARGHRRMLKRPSPGRARRPCPWTRCKHLTCQVPKLSPSSFDFAELGAQSRIAAAACRRRLLQK